MTFPSYAFKGATLFLKVGPDTTGEMTLYTGPSRGVADDNSMPLHMSPDPEATMTLVLPEYPSEVAHSGLMTLFMPYSFRAPGTAFETPMSERPTLYTLGQGTLSSTGVMPLSILAGSIPTDSGVASLYLSNQNQSIGSHTLFVSSFPKYNDSATLEIKRPYGVGNIASLYVKSTNPTNTMPLVVSSTNGAIESNVDLVIRTDQQDQITLHTIGYSE